MTQLDGKSKDLVNENIEKLKEIFPEVFSEGKIDFSKLEEELGNFKEKSDGGAGMLILSGGHERFNCAGIQFNGAFRDSRFAGNSLSGTAVGAEELHNHFRLYYSQCSIGDTAAAAGFRRAIEPDSDQKVCRDRISCGSPCYGGTHRTLFLSAGYRQK